MRPKGHERYHSTVSEDVMMTLKTGCFWYDVPSLRTGEAQPEPTWVPVYVERAICDLIPDEGYAREIARVNWKWDDEHPTSKNDLHKWQNEAIRQRVELIAFQAQIDHEAEPPESSNPCTAIRREKAIESATEKLIGMGLLKNEYEPSPEAEMLANEAMIAYIAGGLESSKPESKELLPRPTEQCLDGFVCYYKSHADAYMDQCERLLAEEKAKVVERDQRIRYLETKFAPLLTLDWVGHTTSATITAMSDEKGLRHIKAGTYAIHSLAERDKTISELKEIIESDVAARLDLKQQVAELERQLEETRNKTLDEAAFAVLGGIYGGDYYSAATARAANRLTAMKTVYKR